MTRARRWDRLLWGVQLRTIASEPPLLIGCGWHTPVVEPAHPDEPTRALLFRTRQAARSWCAAKNAHWRAHGDSIVRRWRVRPVRVRECVTVVIDRKPTP